MVEKVSVEVCPKNPPKRNKRRGGGRNGGNGRGAPVSTAVSIATKNAGSVKLHGTDRIIHVDDVSGYGTGHVLVDLSMSCSTFKRLSHMSEAYQRVRFKKLVFRIVTMCSTGTSGGFAAAFCADPTDVLGDGSDALDRVVAQVGGKVTKFWESVTIPGKLVPDLLYTSQPPTGDLRLASPGRLWVVIESKASTKVPLTIYCDWAVDLSVPSLEGHASTGGALVVQQNFFSKKSTVGLWFTANGTDHDDPRPGIPGLEFDRTYETRKDYFFSFDNSRDGNFNRFKLVNDPTHGVTLAPVSPDGKTVIDKSTTDQWGPAKGETFTPIPLLEERGSEFLCRSREPAPAFSLKKIGNNLPNFDKDLSRFSTSGTSSTRACPGTSERSDGPLKAPSSSQKEHILRLWKELQMECPSGSSALSRSPSFDVIDDVQL